MNYIILLIIVKIEFIVANYLRVAQINVRGACVAKASACGDELSRSSPPATITMHMPKDQAVALWGK